MTQAVSDDERWPLDSALVWIATRSFATVDRCPAEDCKSINDYLSMFRDLHGCLPPGPSAGDALSALWAKLASGELTGRATISIGTFEEVLRSPTLPPVSRCIASRRQLDQEFPPPDDRGLIARLKERPKLIFRETPAPHASQEADWRDISFARADIVRLWPEHPQAAAHRRAKAVRWSPPEGLKGSVLAALPEGARVPLEAVVNTLAFAALEAPRALGDVERIAARLRAAYALFSAARDGRVVVCGTPAQPLGHHGNPLFPAGPREQISPLEFDNDALALSHLRSSAIGAEKAAAHYAEQGACSDVIKWFDVSVDRASLAEWLGEAIEAAPGERRSGGRPPGYDWPAIEREALRLMEHHGDFTPDDPRWNAQARLEQALEQFCMTAYGREPASSTLRKRLASWLEDWRSAKRAG